MQIIDSETELDDSRDLMGLRSNFRDERVQGLQITESSAVAIRNATDCELVLDSGTRSNDEG